MSSGRRKSHRAHSSLRPKVPLVVPAATSNSPTLLTFGIATTVFFTLLLFGIILGPSPISGDEAEYYVMTYGLAMNGSPVLTPSTVNAIRTALPNLRAEEPVSAKALDGSYDALHFWFFSMLASPFFLLCRALGLDWRHCFVFVNAITFAAALSITFMHLGLRAAFLLVAGLLVSPLVPYLNKAHPETFSVSLLIIAITYLWKTRILPAALAMSLVSAQITAFSPLAAVLLIYWAGTLWMGKRLPARREQAIATICCCLLAVQPIWTICRHHTLNLIVANGYVATEMATPGRIAGFFIDPDVGLLFNWPLGIGLGILTIIGLWRHPGLLRHHPTYWAFAIGATAFISFVSAQQTNYTTSIPRYSFWLMPLFLISFALVYERELEQLGRGRFTAATLVFVVGAAATGYYNGVVVGFRPILKRRPLAELWYRVLPWVYNPDEQVFADITLGEQRADARGLFFKGRYPINVLPDPHIWALSNKACTKLLVFGYAFTSSHVEGRLPFGCEQLVDPVTLLHYVARSRPGGMQDRYVNISWHEIKRMNITGSPPALLTPQNRPPHVDSITTRGAAQTSKVTYILRASDPDGWQDIDSLFLAISAPDAGSPLGLGCYLVYNQPRHELSVARHVLRMPDDSLQATALTSPAIPGQRTVLRGEYCRVEAQTVRIAGDGSILTVTIPVTLDNALALPEVLVRVGLTDLSQSTSGWSVLRTR